MSRSNYKLCNRKPSRAKRDGRGEGVLHSSKTPREAYPLTAIVEIYESPAGSHKLHPKLHPYQHEVDRRSAVLCAAVSPGKVFTPATPPRTVGRRGGIFTAFMGGTQSHILCTPTGSGVDGCLPCVDEDQVCTRACLTEKTRICIRIPDSGFALCACAGPELLRHQRLQAGSEMHLERHEWYFSERSLHHVPNLSQRRR
jgi:hypothetical protein